MKHSGKSQFSIFLILASLLMMPWAAVLDNSPSLEGGTAAARASTTWSGDIWVNSSVHVSSSDNLVISDCTQVWMATGTRIYIDGRLTVQGTQSCPVKFHSQGQGDHYGIQFNSTSKNRGSVIENLSIEDSEYAITIYGSNPTLNNLTVENADRVAVDLYNSASPIIHDLFIQDGGQGLANAVTWRQGIGLSVGNYSTPIVDGFIADGLENRALNVWGNSGGLYRNFTFTNIGGSVLSLSAAIWIEDSQLLIEDVTIVECDNGVYIRHISDGSVTRAVMRRISIEDSQFRGLMVDKADHLNYSNYQTAVIEDLVIRGTGGPGAADQGWAEAALEINASGAWIERALIEDNMVPGIRLYFTDSMTTFKDIKVMNSGQPNGGPHSAGVYNRAAFFAPEFQNLTVQGSPGPGIWTEAGGAMQGSDWTLSNNSAQGLWIDGSSLVVDGLNISDNNLSGVRVYDSRRVELSNLTSSGNGAGGSGPSDGAGMVFIKSNDIESNSGDVRCRNCILRGDAWGGIWAQNSVDLWLENVQVHNPLNDTPAIAINNGGLTQTQQGGRFQMHAVTVWVNRSGPAIEIEQAAGVIDGLEMRGSHQGLRWDADHNGMWTSELSNTVLRGSDCLLLSNHSDLIGHGLNISNDCSGSVQLNSVVANWSTTYDESGNHVISLDSTSTLRLHQANNVNLTQAIIPSGANIDLAWDITIWVINQRGNGVPRADVEVSFDQYSNDFDYVSDWQGYDKFPNFIGQRWDSNGASAFTQVGIQCSYDNTTNSTSFALEDDGILYCVLDLSNQPPFLVWSTPEDQSTFPSGAAVTFNASGSWDLDDDLLTYQWTSSINGEFGSESLIVVNDGQTLHASLSDGVHDITLEICDEVDNCVSETRTIELRNLPPIASVTTFPPPGADNVLRVAWTENVTFNTSDTIDPEGDLISRQFRPSYKQAEQWCSGCEDEWNETFADALQANFTIEIAFDDGINPEVTWNIDVELYNELPIPELVVERDGNSSDQIVRLNSTASIDPEGDAVTIRWISSIDGLLGEANSSSSELAWQGHLSRGSHSITVQTFDDWPAHLGQVNEATYSLVVENSIPEAIIDSPVDSLQSDSSTLLNFSAEGSGDWDSWCSTFPSGIWLCSNDANPLGSDWLSVEWSSDISGRLTPEAQDWLIWEGRLEAGNHIITLTIDDLLGGVSSTSISVDVSESAPVLNLVSPYDGQGFLSKDTIWIDASSSLDYDGDSFTLSLTSDHPLVDELLIEEGDPMSTYPLSLPAGTHHLSFLLEDEKGMKSLQNITVVVADSAPEAIIDSPELEPGVSKRMSPRQAISFSANSSNDADGDIASIEWYRWNQEGWHLILNKSWGEVQLSPGNHHIKLVVTDTRSVTDEVHFNLTLDESWPSLSDLTVSKDTFRAGEKSTIEVTVRLTDEDGTTEQVEAIIVHGIQKWNFTLEDNGDGTWSGSLEFKPKDAGHPQLKVVATDHSGDDDVTSTVSLDLNVNEAVTETNWGVVGGGIGGGAFVILLLIFLASRRRRKLGEMDIVESWTSFDAALQDKATPAELDQAALVEEQVDEQDAPSMIEL